MKNILKFTFAKLCWFLIFCSFSAHAEITIVKAEKGKAVLQFDLAADGLKKGDKLRASDGTKDALIVVSKVKGNKAVGKVKTGEVKKEMKVTKIDVAKAKAAVKSQAKSSDTGSAKKKLRWGVAAGANLATMQVKLTSGATTETANMTGTSYGLKGYGEIPIGSSLWIRGGLGYEMVDVKGTISNPLCGLSSSCVATIGFASLDGIGGWNFINGGFKMNVFGGAGLLFPSSPVTNALDTASIKQSAAIKVGAGIVFGKKTSFPIEVEYNMLPASADVKTTFIQVRGGITF